MHDKMSAILIRHCQTVRLEAEAVDRSFEGLGEEPSDWDATKATFLLHRIKGSSGSLGFPLVSEAARVLEDRLSDVDFGEIDGPTLAEIARLQLHLQAQVDAMTPENSTLQNKFLRTSR